MLQAASNIAPRGVYVCGNTTTTSGLTVTLSKDGSSGDYSLEAGALVLGDQGKLAGALGVEPMAIGAHQGGVDPCGVMGGHRCTFLGFGAQN